MRARTVAMMGLLAMMALGCQETRRAGGGAGGGGGGEGEGEGSEGEGEGSEGEGEGSEGEGEGGGERLCGPGATQACVCAGGQAGGQVCAADGRRWLPCDCGAAEGEGEGVAEGEGEGVAEGEGEGREEAGFRWLRICSITEPGPDDRYPGPDIDAVQVCDFGASCFYATQLGPRNIVGGNNQFPDASEALGEPDTESVEIGSSGANFVSLGERGHYLIVGFERNIVPGAEVTVYEIGTQFNPSARNEPSRVAVGLSDSYGGTWIRAGEGTDVFRFSAPPLTGELDGPCE